MKSPITAIIIESDANAARHLVETFKSFGGEVRLLAVARNLQEGMKSILASTPHIIVLEVKALDQGTRDLELLLSGDQQSAVFVTSAEKSSEWILRLIRGGASEFLTRPVNPSELLDAVRKVAKLHTVQNTQSSKRGEVISVYNPCAGMGTTTIAVNLAATQAAQGHSTALVDLNLLSRDITSFLDLTPRYALDSVLPKMGQVDANFIKSIMAPHSCGVQVLDGPESLLAAGSTPAELLQEVIAILRTIFDYTVIDTGGELYGRNLAIFARSNQVLFTTVLNLPALRNAKRYLTTLDSEGFGPDRVRLLVNRLIPRDDIKVSEAEKVLGTKAYLTLPNCYTDAKTAINKGEPLVRCLPRSSFAKSMDQLAKQLYQESSES